MNINGNVNPQWTVQMQHVHYLTSQNALSLLSMFSRIQDILLSFISLFEQAYSNGTLQDKMTFEEISEVLKYTKECVEFLDTQIPLIHSKFTYFEIIKYSNTNNLAEIFYNTSEEMIELLVSLQIETEDRLTDILEITETFKNFLSTEES